MKKPLRIIAVTAAATMLAVSCGVVSFTGRRQLLLFSDSEITDISRDMVASIIDYDALIKISRQLDVSMGGMMVIVDGFAVILFMVLLYLLSRMIIEKNAQPISMTKILGYSDAEIARLYIVTMTIVTLLILAVTIPLENVIMKFIFMNYLAARMSGWITDTPPALMRVSKPSFR
jgi:putative ABC transport system permease protein